MMYSASDSKMDEVISFVSQFVYEQIDCEQSTTNLNDILKERDLLYQVNMLGQKIKNNSNGFLVSIFEDGRIEKKYILK